MLMVLFEMLAVVEAESDVVVVAFLVAIHVLVALLLHGFCRNRNKVGSNNVCSREKQALLQRL